MADERIEDITGGRLRVPAAADKVVILDASDTTDDADGTVKFAHYEQIGYHGAALIDGLILSNNGTDAAHDIDIGTGVCTVTDGTDHIPVRLTSTLVKRIDASWAVGTNQGGLDGTESVAGTPDASTWYHVWLIYRSDTGVVDAVFSETATGGPTLPASYDFYRRIGAVLTDSSANIIAFSQAGDEFLWKTPVSDFSDTNPGTSAQLNAMTVPLGVRVQCDMSIYLTDTTYAGTTELLLTSPDQTDTAPSSTVFTVRLGTSGTVAVGEVRTRVRTDTSQQTRYRLSDSTASHFVRATCYGWVDPRGRTVT